MHHLGTLKGFLFGTACVFALSTGAALANPEGGTVVGGSADFAYNGNKLDVYQHTNRAVIDWRSFNIGAMEHTQFHQPGADSLVVNRINDINPSRIDGKLSANGHVVLINPNGVMFGAGSRVDVGSLTATTADITNDDAMAGHMNFTAAGHANGKIVNAGHITARDAGLVTLVAPQVENSGVIEARLGKVTLASAETFTIDMAGDGLVKVAVDRAQFQQHVKNSGVIQADGGRVVMTAGAARDIVDSLIVNTGQIRAKKGSVKIAAQGVNKTAKQGASKVINAGSIDVSGTDAPADKGGSVTITADEIELAATSHITASGSASGGTVRVGGEYLGGGILPTARNLRADAGSVITADAIQNGDGGEVILWSDGSTRFDGLITARGGTLGGNGGFIETSGKINLGVNGIADVSAQNGVGGTWLLDPSNVRIIRPGGTNIGGGTTHASSDDFLINADSIQTALNGGATVNITTDNATGTEAGDITIDATITWSGTGRLNLYSENNIIVNQAITGRNIYFYAGSDVQINANLATNLANNGVVVFYNRYNGGSIGVGDSQIGAISLSNAELNRIQDGFSRIYFGSNSTDTVNVGAYTWKDNVEFYSSDTGSVNINGTTNLNANNLRVYTGTLNTYADILNSRDGGGIQTQLIADAFNIGGKITGTAGRLDIYSRTTGKSWGLGDSAAGDIIIGTTAMQGITGFSAFNLGNSTTGNIEIGNAITWGVGAGLSTANTASITINGAQTVGDKAFGLSTGTINVSATGSVSGIAGTNIWKADAFNIHGAVTAASLLGFHFASNLAQAPNITADITAATIAFIPTGTSQTLTFGVGDGTTGNIVLSNSVLGHLKATNVNFGGTMSTWEGNLWRGVDVAARDWTVNRPAGQTLSLGGEAVTFRAGNHTLGAGGLNIYTTSTPIFGGNITGTGGFAISGGKTGAGTSDIGVGDSATGDILLTNANIDMLKTAGFSSFRFGERASTYTNNVDFRYGNWDRALTIYAGTSGTININDDIVLTSNHNMSIWANTVNVNKDIHAGAGGSATLSIAADNLTLTGTLSGRELAIAPFAGNCCSAGNLGLGDGAAGNLVLDTAMLAKIQGYSFNNLVFGRFVGTLDIREMNWTASDLEFVGTATINGVQNFGNAKVHFRGNTSTFNILHAMNGTGDLSFASHGKEIALGSGVTSTTGMMYLDDNALAQISSDFSSVSFGTGSTTNLIINRLTPWQFNNLTLTSGGNYAVSLQGNQDFGTHNVTIRANTLNLNANLTGTGTITFTTISNDRGIGIGDTASGGLLLNNTALGRISDSFSKLIFGTTTGARNILDIRAYDWKQDVEFVAFPHNNARINVNGIQNFGAHNATFIINPNNLTVNHALRGTGTLTFTTPGVTTLGIGDGSGAPQAISSATLDKIQDGFSEIIIRSNGNMIITDRTWLDNVTFVMDLLNNTMNIVGTQNFGANNAKFISDRMNISGALVGTGSLTFGNATATTMGIGNSSTGDHNINDAELAFIQDGFSTITFGNELTTALDLRAGATWKDNTVFTADAITIATAQNFGANNTKIITDTLSVSQNLHGTGTITFDTRTDGKGIQFGRAVANNLNITDGIISRLGDSGTQFSKVIIGDSAGETSKISTHSVDLSTKAFDLEMFGNGISVTNGFIMGAGNILIHSMDSDNTLTPASLGTVGLDTMGIVRNVAGHAKVELRADAHITLNGGITQANPGTLDIIINANRDNQNDGGHVSISNADLTTNGGSLVIGGGTDPLTMAATGTSAIGIHLVNSNINTGAGNISMRGQGENTGGNNYGVYLVNSTMNTTSGAIDIIGTGGGGTTFNYGVYLSGSQAITQTGNITLKGNSNGTGVNNGGVYLYGSGLQSDDGEINIEGTGSSVGTSGVGIISDLESTIKTIDGNIILTGYSHTASTGINLSNDDASIQSTNGDIRLKGTSANGGAGINLNGIEILSDGSSNITLEAISSSGTDLRLNAATRIAAGAGTTTILADEWDASGANAATLISSTSGDVHIKARNHATDIFLGTTGAGLALNDATLAKILPGGKLIIGDAASGTGNVSIDSLNLSATTHNLEVYGNAFTLTDTDGVAPANTALTMGGGNIFLKSKGALSIQGAITGNSSGNLTLEASNNITLNSVPITNTGSGNVNIHAGTDGSGYIYLAGQITLDGALTLNSGSASGIGLGNGGGITANGITVLKNMFLYNSANPTTTINARTGTLTLQALTQSGVSDRNIVLIADDMSLNGAVVTTPGRTLDIRTHTAGRAITLGGGAGGGLELDDTELSYLQPGGKLTFGTAGAGTGALTVNTATFNGDVALYGGQIVLNGLSSAGTIFAQSQGAGNDITLTGVVSSSAAGDAITLVSADDFFNNAGAGALVASNAAGRWLVYSERMDHNVRGGLMPDAVEFNVTYPTGPAGAGNRLLYSTNVRPTLTIKVNDDEIFYDEDYAAGRYGYTISGGLVGGDTMGNIGLSGALDYSTTYVFGTTDPSPTPYDDMLNATAGTLTSLLGYQIGTIDGGALLVKGVRPPKGPALPTGGLPPTYQAVSSYPTILTPTSAGGTLTSAGHHTASTHSSNSSSPSTDDGEGSEGGGQGRVALIFSDAYDFSTNGLNLNIDQQVRTYYGLPN